MAYERLPPEQVLEQFSYLDEKTQQLFLYFAENTSEDILKNFRRLEISPHGHQFSGDLERSLYWVIYNKAGGKGALISFYYLHYGRFVELAVQRRMKYIQIPAIPGMDFAPIPRPDGKRRSAKPAITSEIRRHARKIMTRLAGQYAYVNQMGLISGFASDNSVEADVYKMQTEGWSAIVSGRMAEELAG